jgi:hypothetical protein
MFVNAPNYNNIIAYHGPISLNLTSFVGNYMKESVMADQRVITRIFKVFIELVQNVSNYSAQVNDKLQDEHQKRNGIGWFRSMRTKPIIKSLQAILSAKIMVQYCCAIAIR